MKRFEHKNVMITGCNRGIGRVMMEAFVQEGAHIIACTRSLPEELKTYYQQLRDEYQVEVYPIQMDLQDEESIREGLKQIGALKIPVDVLVNNAGMEHGSLLMFTKMAEMRQVFQVNFFAHVQITQYIAKMMMRQKKGSIVMMSSVLGLDATAGTTVYGTSKAAIAQFTKVAAQELAPAGVRVNAVAPNVVNTDMGHKMDERTLTQLMAATPMGRIAEPEEVAKVVLFLASEEASYVNGQVIRIDGGLK